MKSIKDCFKEAKEMYLKANPYILENIEEEATYLTEIFMMTKEEYVTFEVNKAFEKYLLALQGNFTVKVIELTTPDKADRVRLIKECYQREAEALGYGLEEFLIMNNVNLERS